MHLAQLLGACILLVIGAAEMMMKIKIIN